jgi:hypothetical protein
MPANKITDIRAKLLERERTRTAERLSQVSARTLGVEDFS